MLNRFDRIGKIGLFEIYTHSNGCEFREVTLIYGENGVGKSTLAAILDSLRENNPSEILRRRSLPGTSPPTAVVRSDGNDYTFDGVNWDQSHPHDTLEIFYPAFVTRNVHAATEIASDHRRNLCEFVLGRKAVASLERLAETDRESRKALEDIKGIERQLNAIIRPPDTLETFPSLANDACVDERITAAQAELKQARSKEAILNRPIPAPVTLPSIAPDAIAAVLDMSIDGVAANLSDLIQKHIAEHLPDGRGENWLATGSKYAELSTVCPFCAQELTGSTIAHTIQSYFSAAYRRHCGSLSDRIEQLRTDLGSAYFASLRNAITVQVAIAAQWSAEFPVEPAIIEGTLANFETVWNSAASKVAVVLAAKQSKPLDRIGIETVEGALADFARAIDALAEINGLLALSAQKAKERKTSLSKSDTREIELRLARLENQKARFQPAAQGWLEQRNGLLEKRKELASEKEKLKLQINQDANRVVGKYQEGINHYLAFFQSDISVDAVEPGFPSGKASVKYTLKAHGHEINLGACADQPCFETVFSEGDKYTLALSFFLARLREHPDLTGRVVVLDDPVNSLGSSRRVLVLNVIRDLRRRGAQVVVLTHDDQLAARIWRDKKLNRAIVALCVEKTKTGSRLVPWNIEDATRTEYVSHYLSITDFLDNGGDHKPAAVALRPYVEQRLRHLFPGPPFATRDSLGDLIQKIREAAPGSRLVGLKQKLSDLEAINDATVPSHHATDDVPGLAAMTANEVRMFATKAIDVLG